MKVKLEQNHFLLNQLKRFRYCKTSFTLRDILGWIFYLRLIEIVHLDIIKFVIQRRVFRHTNGFNEPMEKIFYESYSNVLADYGES